MKTVGIDARLYSQTGVGTYLRNFLHFLSQNTFTDTQFIIYLLESEIDTIHFKNPAFKKVGVPYHWHSVSEQFGFYSVLMRDNLDLMHFTYFSYPVLYKRPYIATVHDLTPIQFRTGRASTKNPLLYEIKHAVFQYVLKSQIQNAKKVITPTKTVKKQLLEYYPGTEASKIIPLYEGVDYELSTVKENSDLKNLYKKPFFLYVGNFYPHKNVDRLIEAITRIPEKYDLILSGPNDFFAGKMATLIKERKLSERVFLHHRKGKEDLMYFYNHAEALIHPSLSEGFGLPLVEAMWADLPIIASKIPVFEELLPAGTPLFEPSSAIDIAETIQNFLKTPKKAVYRPLMSQYSFEVMTKETLKIYNSLL